jgi:hypothetical protein
MSRTAEGFLTPSMRAISAGRIWKSLFSRNHFTPAGKLPERSGGSKAVFYPRVGRQNIPWTQTGEKAGFSDAKWSPNGGIARAGPVIRSLRR